MFLASDLVWNEENTSGGPGIEQLSHAGWQQSLQDIARCMHPAPDRLKSSGNKPTSVNFHFFLHERERHGFPFLNTSWVDSIKWSEQGQKNWLQLSSDGFVRIGTNKFSIVLTTNRLFFPYQPARVFCSKDFFFFFLSLNKHIYCQHCKKTLLSLCLSSHVSLLHYPSALIDGRVLFQDLIWFLFQ